MSRFVVVCSGLTGLWLREGVLALEQILNYFVVFKHSIFLSFSWLCEMFKVNNIYISFLWVFFLLLLLCVAVLLIFLFLFFLSTSHFFLSVFLPDWPDESHDTVVLQEGESNTNTFTQCCDWHEVPVAIDLVYKPWYQSTLKCTLNKHSWNVR